MTPVIALAGMAVSATSDGRVKVGDASIPGWMAADLGRQLLEAAGSTPAAQATRRKVREHLDEVFAAGWPVRYRDMDTHQYAMGALVHRCDRTALLRMSDTVTALVVREGATHAHSTGLQVWRWDSLAGAVFDLEDYTTRLSVRWAPGAALPRRVGRRRGMETFLGSTSQEGTTP